MDTKQKETQESISNWADETFKKVSSNLSIAIRANEEMSELLKELSLNDNSIKAAEEAADVVIVLFRLFNNLGVNMHDEIDKKMQINRSRDWNIDHTGHGYHKKNYEVAWLVEYTYQNGSIVYWNGKDFVSDSNLAIRFSRKEDAEAACKIAGENCAAQEHMWVYKSKQ